MDSGLRGIAVVLRTTANFLLFRRAVPDLDQHAPFYILVGLALAWIVGIGRHWDNPNAELWQQFGFGSIAYVFAMSFFLLIVLAPLRPKNWNFLTVFVFVTMTSSPALLYAIPIEKFAPFETAQLINMLFLVIVASWRIGLFARFLRWSGGLEGGYLFVAVSLPLALIVFVLALFNLDHAVFETMAGLRREQTVYDSSFGLVNVLAVIAFIASPFLLIGYIVAVFARWRTWDEN